jgi:valyl-tRNA synthetase
MIKPRLYGGEEEVSANLLWVLERVLALLHPMMPFVTEEIWSYHPARRGHLAVHEFPTPEESLIDTPAEEEVAAGIDLTRRLRAWRDLVEAPAATVLPARAEGAEPPEFVGRLARFEFGEDTGEPVAGVGPVRILESTVIDAAAARSRVEARREELRGEVARADGKLANERFVANAPPEVVDEEREKLDRYSAELEELSE